MPIKSMTLRQPYLELLVGGRSTPHALTIAATTDRLASVAAGRAGLVELSPQRVAAEPQTPTGLHLITADVT